jgi:hypothetical protein
MADDIAEQIKPHVREILRIFKGRTLGELNKLVAQTSKLKLQSITNIHAKVIMVQNFDIEIGQEETSSVPIRVQFTPLRRSNRLLQEKRTYEKMQGPNTTTSRTVKRPKIADDECFTDTLPTDDATDGSTSEALTEPPGELPIEPPAENPQRNIHKCICHWYTCHERT